MRGDPDWKAKAVSPEDAVAHIKSGMNVFIHGAAATPTPLLTALCKRQDLADVHLYHLHLSGDIPFADPSQKARSFLLPSSRDRRCESLLKRGVLTLCRSFLQTSPDCSPPTPFGWMQRSYNCRPLTGTGSVPWAHRSTLPKQRPTQPLSLSPRSMTKCPAPTATLPFDYAESALLSTRIAH